MLGKIVKELREQSGWSQSELARRASIAPAQINYLESGKRSVTWETACKIADALGVTVDDLR